MSTHQTVATATAASTGIGRLRAVWNAVLGGIGTVVGIAPHVLHHVGLFVGTALVAGTGGTVLFGIVGMAASLPLLWRLKKRFGTWWAPAIGLIVFASMFTVSAFVIGPILSGPSTDVPSGEQPSPPTEHSEHH